MSQAAQLALLSKLDSTDPPPQTVGSFTANDWNGSKNVSLAPVACSSFELRTEGDLLASSPKSGKPDREERHSRLDTHCKGR